MWRRWRLRLHGFVFGERKEKGKGKKRGFVFVCLVGWFGDGGAAASFAAQKREEKKRGANCVWLMFLYLLHAIVFLFFCNFIFLFA